MFHQIFHTEYFRPDQVKIYPCEVMDWTRIKDDFEKCLHKPYGTIEKDQIVNPLIPNSINFVLNSSFVICFE